LFIRHGANDKRRLQLQDVFHRFHVPAVAQFWEFADGSDVGAPFCYTYDQTPRPDRAQDRCGAGRKGNDANGSLSRDPHGFM
jgi:hypothetical protein